MTTKFLQYKKKYLKLKGGSCKNNDDDEEANLYVTDDEDDEHVENSNVILQPEPESEAEAEALALREWKYYTSKYYIHLFKDISILPWSLFLPYWSRTSNQREEYKKRLEVFIENEEVQTIQKIKRGKERGLHLCFIFETTYSKLEIGNIVKTFLTARGLINDENYYMDGNYYMYGRYKNCLYIIEIQRLIENTYILKGVSFQGGEMQNIFKNFFDEIKDLFTSDRHRKGAGSKKEY